MSDAIQKTSSTALDVAMRPLLQAVPNIQKLLPPGLNIDRFMMQIRRAIMKAPGLAQCTPASLVGAVLEAADLGLDPSGRLGSAYLIPFKNEVTLVPGYRGLIDLAGRSGLVRSINAFEVYEKDHFNHRVGFTPEHVTNLKEDPGAWYAVWARARMAGNVIESEVMRKAQVMKIKARSPGASSGKSPWNTSTEDEIEMAKKTVLRRLLKKLPLSPDAKWDKLARAMDLGDGAVLRAEDPSKIERVMVTQYEGDLELDAGEEESADSSQKPATAVDVLRSKL